MLVYCKLPHGITLDLVDQINVANGNIGKRQTVTLKGQDWKTTNKMRIKLSEFGVTQVDDKFWAEWLKRNPEFPALKSGAIFAAKAEVEGSAILKATEGQPTGFEQTAKEAMGVKPRKDDE